MTAFRVNSSLDINFSLAQMHSTTHSCLTRTRCITGCLPIRQVIDEQKLETGTRLPPLLLLVIYNGEQRWKAATT